MGLAKSSGTRFLDFWYFDTQGVVHLAIAMYDTFGVEGLSDAVPRVSLAKPRSTLG
jgi:hypothetical protein